MYKHVKRDLPAPRNVNKISWKVHSKPCTSQALPLFPFNFRVEGLTVSAIGSLKLVTVDQMTCLLKWLWPLTPKKFLGPHHRNTLEAAKSFRISSPFSPFPFCFFSPLSSQKRKSNSLLRSPWTVSICFGACPQDMCYLLQRHFSKIAVSENVHLPKKGSYEWLKWTGCQ